MYIIVGVDPGTTFAIAAVDLKGRLVGTWSGRDAGKEETLAHARSFGVPCIFASDVSKAPDSVAKLASYANTRLFLPPRDLTQHEKMEITRGIKCANEHEADALAAAIKAYHHYENKLRLIDRVVSERGLAGRADEIKRLAIGGLSVHSILMLLEEEEREEKPEGKAAKAPAAPSAISRNVLSELSSLIHSNIELRKAVERLEREKRALEEKLAELERSAHARLARDREIRHRDRIIYTLRQLLSRGRKGGQKARPRKDLKTYTAKEKKVDLEAIIDSYRQK